VDIARMEGASTIAHGCNGQANDELRLTLGIRTLDPALTIVAAARLWGMSRAEAIGYARARRIPISEAAESPYSVDANLWGRSIERGVLEDPWQESPEEIYALTRAPQDCPDEPAYVEIEFERGVPRRVNDIEMPLVDMIESLETIAGAHGVGRIDMVENATTGAKSREIYEAPAAVILHTAHNELQKLVVPRDLERLAHDLGRTYADLVYNGQWLSPTREALDGFVRAFQPRVTGVVRLKLFKGDCRVVGRRAACPITSDAGSALQPPAAERIAR
jgi:argininosuccinate synthase